MTTFAQIIFFKFHSGPNNKGGGVDIKDILDFYFQTCSMEMNAESMAVMAGTLKGFRSKYRFPFPLFMPVS